MATIKSYTDVEQSRKLAEILPLESANMCYRVLPGIKEGMPVQYIAIVPDDAFFESDIPCWSLAALLSVLPNEIITDKSRFECHYQIDIRKYDGGDNTTLYQIAYGNSRGLSGSWHDMINTGEKENLIDACADMIENLHKLKML